MTIKVFKQVDFDFCLSYIFVRKISTQAKFLIAGSNNDNVDYFCNKNLSISRKT